MIFAFVDESGKPYPSEADTHPTLTAVCCDSDNIKELTKKLYNAEIRVFGDDPTFTRQLKGNKMISSRSVNDQYNNIISLKIAPGNKPSDISNIFNINLVI